MVFDLDGTLTETKSAISPDMSQSLSLLLNQKNIAIIGGGSYKQFKIQLLSQLACRRTLLSRLFLFPTTATSFYRYSSGWKKIYRHELSKKERVDIKKAFREVLKEINYVPPKKTYGVVIEDRGTQVTFSVFGQDIVKVLGKKGVEMKKKWTKEHTPLKLEIARLVQKKLPHVEARAAGYTSIDVSKKGIDKGYGLYQIEKKLNIKIKDMLFIGDAIFKGGNDYAVVKTGIDYVRVAGPRETKKVIEYITKKV